MAALGDRSPNEVNGDHSSRIVGSARKASFEIAARQKVIESGSETGAHTQRRSYELRREVRVAPRFHACNAASEHLGLRATPLN